MNGPPAVTTEKAKIPAVLLKPVPIPSAPNPATMTDADIAILMQKDEKAIRAANSQLKSIEKLVETY